MHFSQTGIVLVNLLYLVSAAPVQHDPYNPSDKYIITLKAGVNLAKHKSYVQDLHVQTDPEFRGLYEEYEVGDFRGYAGHFNQSVVEHLSNHEDVQAIEPSQVLKAARIVEEATPNFGLGHISHRNPRSPRSYVYDNAASGGTFAYILDSGINTRHPDFERRATMGFNADPLHRPGDAYGHGTHIAGVVGSKTYGVAKKCKMIGVKVMHDGQTITDVAIKGYQWAVKDIIKRRRQGKAVISISMSGPKSQAFNTAIGEAFSKGITTVVAAGNLNQDANNHSPSSAYGAIVVGATDNRRTRATFSNWGSRIDLFAAGVDIPSTSNRGGAARNSGTSVAAAHVAGLVLYLKTLRSLPDSRATKSYLLSIATTQSVGATNGSPNKFAYNNSGK
ncbi:subtilisin-like protein [Myriangium duriaei CBS 260.36]|uniref:Subtilisin-like protein n=1 Tax=Myriangium duriaei CBS 260.36 TaxID=1168546 RepID=A0A9P4J787_9PEZI|nr:subtilisin-like protein [Myriangium duriaei CBS 260.36]